MKHLHSKITQKSTGKIYFALIICPFDLLTITTLHYILGLYSIT